MTSRDIVMANLERRDPPRPGMCFGGGRLNDFSVFWPAAEGFFSPKRWVEGDKEFYTDEWGNIWVRMVGGCEKGEIHIPALANWDALDSMKWPEGASPRLSQMMRDYFASNPNQFKLLGFGGFWVFEAARYLRKMDAYFLDMALEPDKLHQLHARIGEVCAGRIRSAAQGGADGIFIFEDLGTQKGLLFSPDMFRDYFKPLYTELMGLAHGLGLKVIMHSCGYNWEILDDLMDCGVDCFQFDQPALYDMEALAAKLRARKVALFAPVDIQKVMPTGNRAFIEAETERMIRLFKGGLMLKIYGDLPGIGVRPEWDQWAYEKMLAVLGL